jgi:hypothetical protein
MIQHKDGCLLGCSALMMEAARTSETLVNFYQTTRRYNREDSYLRTHRRENLKSYMIQHILQLRFKTICTSLILPLLASYRGERGQSWATSSEIRGGQSSPEAGF